MVKEFEDLFHNELAELPVDQEIEFTIELVFGAKSISKATYRMASKELVELNM